jgi:hypothetical protein
MLGAGSKPGVGKIINTVAEEPKTASRECVNRNTELCTEGNYFRKIQKFSRSN